MAYQTPPHAVRSLSPITELTTPASARSIALPLVEKAYDYNDYKDESPIQPLTPDVLALVNGHPNGFRHDDNDDRASTHSEGSTRTVVPSSTEPSPLPPVSSDSPLPSPPSALRPFHSPTASLPPPPRPISVKGERSSQPSTPHSAAVPLDPPAVHEPTARLLEGDRPDHHYGEGTDGHDGPHDDEDDRMSVSTAGIAGIGSGTFAETAKKKKGRPKSLHGTRDVRLSSGFLRSCMLMLQPPLSPIASSAAFPSHHASLVDIPNIPNIPPTPDAGGTLGRPASKGAKSPTTSPQRSGPSSPKSRPSTLKKRPNSLHTSRPSSWHSQKSVKVPKNGGRKADKSKGKGKSKIVDMEASGSSNDVSPTDLRSTQILVVDLPGSFGHDQVTTSTYSNDVAAQTNPVYSALAVRLWQCSSISRGFARFIADRVGHSTFPCFPSVTELDEHRRRPGVVSNSASTATSHSHQRHIWNKGRR